MKSNDNYNQDIPNVWRIISWMISIGIMMVISLTSRFLKDEGSMSFVIIDFFTALGIALLIGGAFFTAGGLIGFLFGIPKLLQNTALVPEEVSKKTVIVHNDNLVQISDWLTKIIVGVGLTQLTNIPHYL